MASIGHQVFAYDIEPKRISQLNQGILPFYEPDLEDLLNTVLRSGNLKFTSDIAEAIGSSDVHFLCVGTPQSESSGAADLSQVRTAIHEITPHLKQNSVVVGKSTVPVGTAEWVLDYFKSNSNNEIHLVWNPEFLREGFAVQDTLHPDRIVLGSKNGAGTNAVLEIYQAMISYGTPVIHSNFSTAELVKVAANAFLATKISFINAFSDLCDKVGGDVTVLADAIGYDSRIGRKFLNAGIGFGGGCLPKDIRALQASAGEFDLFDSFNFLSEVDKINQSRKNKIIELAELNLGHLKGKKITILGASFKPNSDDVRDSPAIEIAKLLLKSGAEVVIHDPVSLDALKLKYPFLVSANDVKTALADSDLTLHLTEWSDYRNLNPRELAPLVHSRIIIDGRNVLDGEIWKDAGWKIIFLGKPS